MLLHIADTTTVQALQEAFSALFPYLKLEVLDVHGLAPRAPLSPRRKAHTTLAELRHNKCHAEVPIDPEMTVHDFEQLLLSTFGLHVEIFRLSGRVWLKTMMTDDWTLAFQNEQGRILSTP